MAAIFLGFAIGGVIFAAMHYDDWLAVVIGLGMTAGCAAVLKHAGKDDQ